VCVNNLSIKTEPMKLEYLSRLIIKSQSNHFLNAIE